MIWKDYTDFLSFLIYLEYNNFSILDQFYKNITIIKV
jgi:hypothetical protein